MWSDSYGDERVNGTAYVREPPAPARSHQEIVGELHCQAANALKACRVYVSPFDVRFPKSTQGDDLVDAVVKPDVLIISDLQKLDARGMHGASRLGGRDSLAKYRPATIRSSNFPLTSAPASAKPGSHRPQTAKTLTLSAGADIREIPGLAVNLRYFDIDFRDRIIQPTINSDALTNGSGGQIVTTNPTLQQREAVCTQSQFSGTLIDCLNEKVYALVDARLNNLSRASTNGFDLNINYEIKGIYGDWRLGAVSTYILKYVVASPSGLSSVVDSPGNPIQLRAKGIIAWSSRDWSVDTSVNYLGGYRDFVDQPNTEVRSWTTIDERVTWHMSRMGMEKTTGATVSLSARNVFNHNPPFVNDSIGLGFDPINTCVRGRIVSLDLDLTQHW